VQRLEIDERWGMPCIGYHIQARPDRPSMEKLLVLQQIAANASPVALRLIPRAAIHLSVMTLVPAQPPSEIAERKWVEVKKVMGARSTMLPRYEEGLSVIFTGMRYTERALILVTQDQPVWLTEIREALGELLTSLQLPAPSYNQTHITIARYAERADIDDAAIQLIDQVPVNLTAQFDAVKPICERRYPSLEIEDI
jgi:hypothetical protein